MKNEVVHARVQSNVKNDSETILNRIGISISQAIDLFLRQVVLKKGIPFELNENENKEKSQIEQLAYIINSVDGKEPPSKAKRLIHLYINGDIDYETAQFAIKRMYAK